MWLYVRWTRGIMAKLSINVCMGSSCFARGNAANLEFIENYIKNNGLEAQIDLSGSRCEGKCVTGPNIIINGVEYTEVNEDKLKDILDEFAKV